jgi:hypothetical protein
MGDPIFDAERGMTVGRDFVITKCDYFVDIQLWPVRSSIDPEGWLSNFTPAEQQLATHLLNCFLYFPQPVVEEMLLAAFHSLSVDIPGRDAEGKRRGWQAFCSDVMITPVSGEEPNVSDSGYLFARMARQKIGIPERQLVSHSKAASAIAMGIHSHLVFVDDFVGSGNQFLTTWRRPVKLDDGTTTSFADLANRGRGAYFYCPVMCTEYGLDRLAKECPEVIVKPAHLLTSRYSIFSDDSFVWGAAARDHGAKLLHEASVRAGIGEHGPNGWRGFHNLGLTIAFSHCIPDATLPIYYWEENGWKPLMRRR